MHAGGCRFKSDPVHHFNMKTIKVKKKKEYYIATYTTLDIVTQGETKEEALMNLLELLCIQIDYAVENDNLENLVPKFLKK